MTTARLSSSRDRLFDILNFSEARCVLRDDRNTVWIMDDPSMIEQIEVRCDVCGSWTTRFAATSAGLQCNPPCWEPGPTHR